MRELHGSGSSRRGSGGGGRRRLSGLALAALATVALGLAGCLHPPRPPHPHEVLRHPHGHGPHVPPGQWKRRGPPPHAKHGKHWKHGKHGKHGKHEEHGKHGRGPGEWRD